MVAAGLDGNHALIGCHLGGNAGFVRCDPECHPTANRVACLSLPQSIAAETALAGRTVLIASNSDEAAGDHSRRMHMRLAEHLEASLVLVRHTTPPHGAAHVGTRSEPFILTPSGRTVRGSVG